MAEELAAIEAALWGILEPYRGRLEPGSVYGLATLKRAGATQHAFFAGVRLASHHVAFHLMPIYADPTLLDGASAGLRRAPDRQDDVHLRRHRARSLHRAQGPTATMLRSLRAGRYQTLFHQSEQR